MSIYFRSTPVNEPYAFDSIGNHWLQEPVKRAKGYPLYHFLQSETGRGSILIRDKKYILNEGEGVLIARIIQKHQTQPMDAKLLSIDCYTLLLEFADGIYTEELKKDSLYHNYVEPVIKEMETRYSEKITISQLSSLVFVTPQYLSRLFRRFLGCSAYEYLTTYRLNKAKELLLVNSRMEIQYIAQQVGFEDSSHFIAMFRKMTGVTPMEFRVLYRNIGL
ncbi:MAG: helix-turn-helix transcriptional regulator [Oliverpabstia sp.]